MERDGLRHVTLPKTRNMRMKTTQRTIPNRSSPGPRTASSVGRIHQGGSGNYATGGSNKTIRDRNKIVIGTWNLRTLREAGKIEQLEYEMSRYRWNILGLCEVRRKHFGETLTSDGHKLYHRGQEDKHEHGVGFIVHKDSADAVLRCRPISSRIMTIRLKAAPFNTTIIQAYAPTTDHEDEEVEDFYNEVQKTLNEVSKKDIIVVQGDWNAKIGQDAQEDWEGTCGQYCNQATNDRGPRLLEFAKYNDLKIMNTFGPHKPSRRWTWQSPGGEYHNQIDYILIKRLEEASPALILVVIMSL
ncbi:craniofacial development protein 2 [Plakobranchus ocellatus]|uniref:Craniofacial development protein 2 n=1 Tax=Plakobranchus ocellatus TaxID=259542 RepID=A0AAV4DYI2_9GAST|nr:craniofacial development protein 2 [Plakobranchus ocellatus]